MADPIKALGNGHERERIPPGHLTSPTPVTVVCGVVPVEGGKVMLRLETPTGMHITFFDADLADEVSKMLHTAAVQVRTGLTIAKPK